MTIRFMIDTDNLTDLTGHVEILATYSDLVPVPANLQAKFPHSVIVLIDRGLGDPSGEASVFDIEPGALTIAEAVSKYDAQKAKGVKYLTAYHDRAETDAVKAGFGKRPVYHWIATLDGTAHIQAFKPLFTPAVIQCLSATELGYHADGSLVLEDSWHPTLDTTDAAILRADVADAEIRLQAALQDVHRMAAALGG